MTEYDTTPLSAGSRVLALNRNGKTLAIWEATSPEAARSAVVGALRYMLLENNVDFLGLSTVNHERTHNLISLTAEQLKEAYETYLDTVSQNSFSWDQAGEDNDWAELVMMALMLIHYPENDVYMVLSTHSKGSKKSWEKSVNNMVAENPSFFKAQGHLLMGKMEIESVLTTILKDSSVEAGFGVMPEDTVN